MAKGKKMKGRQYTRRFREDEEKAKGESMKKVEERSVMRTIPYFKSEEMQEICAILNIEELLDDHHCFLGAVVIGKFEVVKKLLKDGHSIDFLDENHETALMHAVKHFRLEMIDFLLARGADISLVDGEDNTVLALAAQNELWDQDSFSGLWSAVRGHHRLSADRSNKLGYSLLHYVTKRQWGGVLGSLLSLPVALNCCTNKGVTPLIMAASRGDAVFVQALLQAGADISLEDQQSCTALCYAIAFSLQKNLTESNRALELLLAATNDENSRLPLEHYLQRRLEILVNPPKNKAEFSKTVSGVLVHVLSFFARFIYSGIELLLELGVFYKLREAIERHLEEPLYTAAVMAVVLELVRHCPCCCQGLSQAELADAFFTAELPKPFLHILHRHGQTKTAMIKAVFVPLLYVCTSDSYRARSWLESNHEQLHTYYNKYMRAFPAVFMETNGDQHLEIEKRCSQSFQTIMRTLKTKGKILKEKDHLQVQKNMSQNTALRNSEYTIMKSNCSNGFSASFKGLSEKNFSSVDGRRKQSKVSAIYSSVIQHNFGKLDFVQIVKDSPNKEETESSKMAIDNMSELETESKNSRKGKKCRIAIKEVQPKLDDDAVDTNENLDNNCQEETESELLLYVPQERKELNTNCTLKPPVRNNAKQRFTEGYQLFKMEDDLHSDVISEEENKIAKERCQWLDSLGSAGGEKAVSDMEVNNTIIYLEVIFNRILNRYDSTWRKQFEKGYLEAEGDSEDLLKLMLVLPALENYHMEKLMNRWSNFCTQVKDHASKNHVLYAAMVSEMQLFLLEFEAKLDENNIREDNEQDNSSQDSYIDTQKCILNGRNKDLNTLSDGKPVEYLINGYTTIKKDKAVETQKNIDSIKCDEENIKSLNKDYASNLVSNIYFSDSGDDENGTINSVWNAKIENFKLRSNLNVVDKSEAQINEAERPPLVKATTEVDSSEVSEVLSRQTDSLNKVRPVCTKKYSAGFTNNGVKSGAGEKLDDRKEAGGTEENTVLYNVLKKLPPGFEHIKPSKESVDNSVSVLAYCGAKYEPLSLALATLPPGKIETLNGGELRVASFDFQNEFKLFNGFNFGNVELGLNQIGMPLAVRKFEKHGTVCNQLISTSLYQLICSMMQLKHENVLNYVSACDHPRCVVFATPLCSFDLGQYIRHQRQVFADNLSAWATFTPTLITMAKQLISGLYYLHNLPQPIVHGNLKPSNILVDVSGTIRLAEFGLHQILFQQQNAPQCAVIWWASECHMQYVRTWKYECTQQSDIQTAGMLVYFILTMGLHPFGESIPDILQNMTSGVLTMRSQEVNATDLLYWMLARIPENRPNTSDVLRHPMFWSNTKKWELLSTCCGLGAAHHLWPLPLDKFYADLDALARQNDIHTAWIAVLKKNCECKIGCDMFEETPSGLLKFIAKNLKEWVQIKDTFLELFPSLPLNLFRMVEQTSWIDHPEFEPFTRVGPLP